MNAHLIKATLICLFTIFTSLLIAQNQLPDEVKVSYWAYKKDIKTILSDLNALSNVNISYDDELIKDTRPVQINVKSKSLGYTLKKVLKRTNLTYRIIGNQLVLIKDEFASLLDDNYTISGTIIDSTTREKLIYAHVYIGDGEIGTETNEYGFYTMRVPKGYTSIHCSYVGYPKKSMPIKVTKDMTVNLEIDPSIELNEILIIDSKINKREEVEDATILPIHNLSSMGSFGGEPDIIRFAQIRAGVTSAADGFGGINVRGGSVDQNLILLDGVPVYHSAHSFGLFSIFNPNAIQSAKLIKNGFPANYGGRLSSVLDIRTKDGNKEKFSGSFKFSPPFISSFTVEGPIGSNNNSFIISGRRTIIDPFIKLGSQQYYDVTFQEGSVNYYFYDVNAKLNLQLSPNHRWYFSYYTGNDLFENNRTSTFELFGNELIESNLGSWDWGNTIGNFRWNMILGNSASANVTAYYSKFNFDFFDLNQDNLLTINPIDTISINDAELYTSNIEDIGLKLDFHITPSNLYQAKFGLNYVFHSFGPGLIQVNERRNRFTPLDFITKESITETLENPTLTGSETRLFLENIFTFGKSAINAGLHIAMVNSAGSSTFIVEPRFSSSFNIFGDSYIKLSYSEMDQFMHLLSSSGFGLPNDLWLPSTDRIKPERSRQVSGGFDFGLGNNWRLSMTGYLKKLSNVVADPEGINIEINDNDDWQSFLAVGTGRSSGFEVTLDKPVGRVVTNINYTYSKATRQFDDINSGNEFPFRFDRRHSFNVSTIFKFSSSAEFVANWTYASGIPFSRPTSLLTEELNGIPTYILSIPSRNNARFNPNHRLDLAINLYSKLKNGAFRYSIGVHNAYNNKNPIIVNIVRDETNAQEFEIENWGLIYPIPYISFEMSF